MSDETRYTYNPFTLHCIQCGHDWIPRKVGRPKECPACQSAYWDDPDHWSRRRKERFAVEE